MIIAHDDLSRDALDGVIEEYVTRDGTELSDATTKAAAIRRGLECGELAIVYDTTTDSCNILPRDEALAAETVTIDEPADDHTF
jgi:uncharacterized protein YheU (UPF0270 family)